jgi:hypothetical protein
VARLPATEQEFASLTEANLHEVWEYVEIEEDCDQFFDALGTIIGADLSPRHRIRIAGAVVGYCFAIRGGLDSEMTAEALRLVKAVRREIVDMQRRLAAVERQAAKGQSQKDRALAGSECWAIYESARQHQDHLHQLPGFSDGVPSERLAEAYVAVSEALHKVGLPFRFADCAGALGILDAVLERGADAVGARKGQNFRSKALSDFIERLGLVIQDATGRDATDRSLFESLVARILKALPRTVFGPAATVDTDRRIEKRIKRLRTPK